MVRGNCALNYIRSMLVGWENITLDQKFKKKKKLSLGFGLLKSSH